MTRYLIVAPLVLLPAVAWAETTFEAGLLVGGHLFSDSSELGVADADGQQSLKSFAGGGGRMGLALGQRLVLEGEAMVVPTKTSPGDAGATMIGLRGHARLNLLTGKVRPFLLAGYGAQFLRTSAAQMENDSDQAIHWGGGLAIGLTPVLELRLDGRHLIVPDRTKAGATSEFEVSGGIVVRFGVSKGAAPPPPSRPVVEEEPVRPPPRRGGDPDADGDSDGINDDKDRCPSQKEDRDGFEDADGCADLDNDGDGIVDAADQCPDQPETKNGYLDDDGCADQVTTELVGFTFQRNSDKFDPAAAALLERAFQVMSRNTRLNVEISGHTSEGETKPLELSIARAEAVKEYLVRRGISEERLRTVGYGNDRPTATNATRDGRDKNRRVEFRLVRPDE
jgi:OOP family OmpA-OmpF porin